MSNLAQKINKPQACVLPDCPVMVTMQVLGGKWKPGILWCIGEQTVRFGDLKRRLPDISQKVLTQQLRELEEDGIIRRVVHAEVPPRVEYSITEYGFSLRPILAAMSDWGKAHRHTLLALAAQSAGDSPDDARQVQSPPTGAPMEPPFWRQG